jgi:hypothetical protein
LMIDWGGGGRGDENESLGQSKLFAACHEDLSRPCFTYGATIAKPKKRWSQKLRKTFKQF